MKNYRIAKQIGNLGRALILLFFLLLVLMPIYWMAITSFKTNSEIIDTQTVTYYPHETTTDNYVQLFELYDYKSMLVNSLIVSVSTGLCITMLSILGGYGLARYSFGGKTTMLLFFLVTQMIPLILVVEVIGVAGSLALIGDTNALLILKSYITSLIFP